mmetsp:Transcript_9344/g.20397  ORF Transcript_9344/g.20397 Transcript_9344/m.20397 type:complete len:250 (-) Transcript_9344:214-963(-)
MSTETAVTFSGTAELGIHPSRTTADHREGQRDCCSRTPQRMLPWPDTTQRQPPSRRPEQRPTTPGETDRSQAELPRMLRQPERQPLPIPTDHRAHRTDNRPWKGADNWCLRYRKGKLEQNRTPTRTRRRHRTQKSKQQLPYTQSDSPELARPRAVYRPTPATCEEQLLWLLGGSEQPPCALAQSQELVVTQQVVQKNPGSANSPAHPLQPTWCPQRATCRNRDPISNVAPLLSGGALPLQNPRCSQQNG